MKYTDIFPTVYWFASPNFIDQHNTIVAKELYNLSFKQEFRMPILDKWFIGLN